MEFKRLIEVKQEGEKIFTATGYDEEIKTPVEISFVADISDFERLRKAANYYKWNLHEAFCFFCNHADFFISAMDAIANGMVEYQAEPWLNN